MSGRSLSPRSLAVGVALCVAAAAGGFLLGRTAPPPEAGPTPAELAASIRAALGQGDALERLQRTASLLEHLGPDNLPEVAAVYDEMRPVIGELELRPFVAAWARIDPGDAFDHALRWPARGRRDVGAGAALESWAAVDPPLARQAYKTAVAEDRRLRKALLPGLVAGWARSGRDPGALAGFIVASGEFDEGIGAAVRELMRSGGPEATVAWVDPILRDTSDRPDFKRNLFRISLRAFARWDPEGASAWAAQHAGEDYAAGGPLVVAGQWGGRAGAATLAWLRGLPAGEPRDKGVHRAFEQWFRADPEAARAWLEAERLEAFHDPALEAFAQELAKQELAGETDEEEAEEAVAARAPEEALGWCERVLDPERGQRCFQVVAGRWYRADAEAAEAWLAQSSLDEEARQVVRRPGRQRGARRPASRQR